MKSTPKDKNDLEILNDDLDMLLTIKPVFLAKTRDQVTQCGSAVCNRESGVEQRYRALFESSCEAILLIDHKHNIVDANPRACTLLGHSREQLCGIKTQMLQPEKSRLHTAGGREHFETEAVRPDGRVLNVEVALTRFQENGRNMYLAIVRDITEHKQSIEELNEREETVRSIINASVEPMMLIDPDGRVLYLNETAAMRLGADVKDLIGSNSYELLD